MHKISRLFYLGIKFWAVIKNLTCNKAHVFFLLSVFSFFSFRRLREKERKDTRGKGFNWMQTIQKILRFTQDDRIKWIVILREWSDRRISCNKNLPPSCSFFLLLRSYAAIKRRKNRTKKEENMGLALFNLLLF